MMNTERTGKKTSYQRIIGANASDYIGKYVCIIGEVISMNTSAKTLTLRLPDDEQIIVLLSKNTTLVEPNRLTEVAGKLVSSGQIEAASLKQFDQKQTALFNKDLYIQMSHVAHAHKNYYEI